VAASVQLGQVRTWYDEHGQGDPLVCSTREGPTLTTADLERVGSRALVMVGDDEATLEHTIAM
jgi:hypothetical protein